MLSRGLVVLALLLVGNLFCAACPFMLPRRLAKWLVRPTRRWPQALRNKWLALICLLAIIYSYELFDLWGTPLWTAWLTVAYFGVAFVLEAFFTRSSFCLYVCPLGTFNFLYSTVSPTQITARSLDTCRSCKTQDCINGNAVTHQDGCQLELFVPTIQSNMNCTFCLDCVRACPHDNVALAVRPPGNELFSKPGVTGWTLARHCGGVAGANERFWHDAAYYRLEQFIGGALNTQSETLVLGLVFLLAAVVIPLALSYVAAGLGKLITRGKESLNRIVMRYAYSFVPLGFAIWFAHYLFHFLTGAMTLVPAFQTFFARTLGLPLLGEPDWTLAALFVPARNTIQICKRSSPTAASLRPCAGAQRRNQGAPQPRPRPAGSRAVADPPLGAGRFQRHDFPAAHGDARQRAGRVMVRG
ncbi:MAG: hypothetical protein R2911_13695 [Caldilineaceae bacterium]